MWSVAESFLHEKQNRNIIKTLKLQRIETESGKEFARKSLMYLGWMHPIYVWRPAKYGNIELRREAVGMGMK